MSSREGWWPTIPVLPPVDEVRATLAGWAREQAMVPDELFDGPLLVSDGSVVRMEVTRLLETRAQSTRTKPGKLRRPDFPNYPSDPNYYERLSTHPLPEEWRKLDWWGVRRASIRTSECDTCSGRGRRRCVSCRGHGFIRCFKTNRCPACRGAGRVETILGMETCTTCHGRKELTCTRCKGSGKRSCSNSRCDGGQTRCLKCSGHGIVTTYDVGRIRRKVDLAVVEAGDGKGALNAADREGYSTVSMDEQPNLSSLPRDLRRELDGELTRKLENEQRRKVRVRVLPVVVVRYHDQDSAETAYLVGPGRRVHAPGARQVRVFGLKFTW